ncbi:MAG: hypothetical protein ACO1SV_08455 [Fimbriimonas sp.]
MSLVPLLSLLVVPQDPAEFRLAGKGRGHSYSVTFKDGPFRVQGRELLWVVADVKGGRVQDGAHRMHALRKRSDWDGEYSSIYAGFRTPDGVRRFWESDGRSYGEVVDKQVLPTLQNTWEIVALRPMLDGKALTVPRRLYWDLLDPHFTKDHTRAAVMPDGSLRVRLMGSDGGGGWSVEWRFRKNGKHTRRMLDPESEI